MPVGLRAPAHVAPPPASDVPADLRRALDEVEPYVSLGFVDDARSALAEVGGRFSAHPALQQRLAELGLELEAPSDMDALLGEARRRAGRARDAERRAAAARRGLSRVHAVDEAADGARARRARGRAATARDSTSPPSWATSSARRRRSPRSTCPARSTDLGDAALADIFKEFKKGVDKQLGKEDYDTRYNLGIAYKEMGLIDEAIAEFQLAAKDESRLLECSSMLGICFLEKGMPKLAVKWFEKGLKAPGRSDEEYQGLRYDLASAHEAAGETRQGARALHRPLRAGRQLPRRRRQGARARRLSAQGVLEPWPRCSRS